MERWVKKWGMLAVTEDGAGFQTNKERLEKLMKRFEKLSEGKGPVGFSTTSGELGSGRPVDDSFKKRKPVSSAAEETGEKDK